MHSVSVKNCFQSFGSTPVLKDVSLEIGAGEFFFLLGPSGCGKTTLLRILAGLESPKSGTVSFSGRDVTRLPTQARNASLVFQSYALWPHLRVAENVAFGLENRKVPKNEIGKKVNESLALVRLEGLQDRLPGQLSGGQQQRVALARALVVGPELLLLDEPLSNLDAKLRADMRAELMLVHRRTKVTTVYVTHDQEEALSMADRIAFMDEGKILQVGTPRDLYKRPATVRMGKFLGSANVVQGVVAGRRGTRITVKTAWGLLLGECDSSVTFGEGRTVNCFFRPENLMAAPLEGGNRISGSVITAMFEGARERLHLEHEGVDFQAIIPSPAEPTIPGGVFEFFIAPDVVRILPE